jgi:hypothetical protein
MSADRNKRKEEKAVTRKEKAKEDALTRFEFESRVAPCPHCQEDSVDLSHYLRQFSSLHVQFHNCQFEKTAQYKNVALLPSQRLDTM